jgi:hypothetical protein
LLLVASNTGIPSWQAATVTIRVLIMLVLLEGIMDRSDGLCLSSY